VRLQVQLVRTEPTGAGTTQILFARSRALSLSQGACGASPALKDGSSAASPSQPHALAAASMLIAQGAHPKIIQERLGHASITTTMNRIGHLFDGQDATLLDGLDAAMTRRPPRRQRGTVPLNDTEEPV